MGFCLTETEAMGEYGGEVRRESFYLRGETNEFKEVGTQPCHCGKPDCRATEPRYEYQKARHGIVVYENGDCGQGTVEILIEDIPKVRAVLDAVEAHVLRRVK